MEVAANRQRKGFVYVVFFSGYHKIGRAKNVQRRIQSLIPTKFPEVPILKLSFEVDDAPLAERTLHFRYREQQVAGEWFNLTDTHLPEIAEFIESGKYLNAPVSPPKFAEFKSRKPPTKPYKPLTAEQKIAKKQRESERAEQNRRDAEARMIRIRDLPRVLRELSFGNSFYVYDRASISAIKSTERKFGYNLSALELGNANGICVSIDKIQGKNWSAKINWEATKADMLSNRSDYHFPYRIVEHDG